MNIAEINDLLNKAEAAFTNNDPREGMSNLLLILKDDFTNDAAWRLLYRVMKSKQPFEVFQMAIAQKNFPEKVHLLMEKEVNNLINHGPSPESQSVLLDRHPDQPVHFQETPKTSPELCPQCQLERTASMKFCPRCGFAFLQEPERIVPPKAKPVRIIPFRTPDQISINGLLLSTILANHNNGITANLVGADLSYTDLEGVNLTGANLKDANLYAAYLINTNLTNVNFEGANLSHAEMDGANLKNAIFKNAIMPDGKRFDPELMSSKKGVNEKKQEVKELGSSCLYIFGMLLEIGGGIFTIYLLYSLLR